MLRRGGDAAMLVAILLVAWQILYAAAGSVALRSPLQTVVYLAGLLRADTFWPHVYETAVAVALALLIAVSSGIALGVTLGFHRLSGDVAEPLLVAAFSVPKVTLYPVILLFFGIGLSAKVAFGAIHGIVPIAMFTMNAVRNIKPVFLKTGRVHRLGPWTMARTVLVPAAFPEVFSGLRVGFSVTLVGTLIAELFGAKRGLGFLLMNAIGLNNTDVIMSVTLLLVCAAAAVNAALLTIDRRLHHGTEVSLQ